MLFQNREGMERGNPLRSTVYRKGLFHLMNETINPGIISKPFFLDTLLHSIAKIVFSIIFFFSYTFSVWNVFHDLVYNYHYFCFIFLKKPKGLRKRMDWPMKWHPWNRKVRIIFYFILFFLIIILGYSMLYPFCVLWRVLYSILVFTY